MGTHALVRSARRKGAHNQGSDVSRFSQLIVVVAWVILPVCHAEAMRGIRGAFSQPARPIQSVLHLGHPTDNQYGHLELLTVDSRDHQLRKIQESAASAAPTAVSTAEELADAVTKGVEHIELRNHLDLTKWNKGEDAILGFLPKTVKSMRGNCKDPVPTDLDLGSDSAPLLPMVSNQCLIVLDRQLLAAPFGNDALWFDGLYLRFRRNAQIGEFNAGLIGIYKTSLVYMTDVNMQGDGYEGTQCVYCGILMTTFTSLYAEDCSFTDFSGTTLISAMSGAASFRNCLFADNTMTLTLIQAGDASKTARHGGMLVRTENSTFESNDASPFATLENSALPIFYSDRPLAVVRYVDGIKTSLAEPLEDFPSDIATLAEGEPDLKGLQQVLPDILRVALKSTIASEDQVGGQLPSEPSVDSTSTGTDSISTLDTSQDEETDSATSDAGGELPDESGSSSADGITEGGDTADGKSGTQTGAGAPPDVGLLNNQAQTIGSQVTEGMAGAQTSEVSSEDGDSSGGGSGMGAGPVVAIVLSAVLVSAVAAVAVLAVMRRRRRSNPTEDEDIKDGEAVKWVDSSANVSLPSSAIGVQNWKSINETQGTYDTFADMTRLSEIILVAPNAAATADDRLEFMGQQLDSLMDVQLPVCGGLTLKQGMHSRMQGGQAVVQFAKHTASDQEFAMKFFLSKSAFEAECKQYTDRSTPLWKFLPQLQAVVTNEDEELVDATGNALPPCIIMEKGESLDQWVKRNRRAMDPFTCMQVIYHICECLADLHTAGYVHRDVKPGNIMWLPSQNRWTLIDFGCMAAIGSTAPLGFSLLYAAPEVVRACYKDEKRTILVDQAIDSWSVGVLCLELFSGKPPLRLMDGEHKVVAQILGDGESLPWEDADAAKEMLQSAGRLRSVVLQLLHRDSLQRLSVSSFREKCSAALSITRAS